MPQPLKPTLDRVLADFHDMHAAQMEESARDMERGGLYGDALEDMRAAAVRHRAWAAALRLRAGEAR